MGLALTMAKMAKEVYSQAPILENQVMNNMLHAEVQAANMRDVNSPPLNQFQAGIDRHAALLRQKHTADYLACPNGTKYNT
jgi:hypothetical protein